MFLFACTEPDARPEGDDTSVVADSAPTDTTGTTDTQPTDTTDSGSTLTVTGPDDPELDALILEQMGVAHVPGLAAAITRGDELLWARGYGLADIEASRPVTPDTPFMLASVSKTVITTAVMQAVEDGLVDLDTDIDTYLPFVVNPPNHPDDPITLRHLVTHTSAIRDRWAVWDDLTVAGDSEVPLGTFMEGYLVEGGDWYQGTNFANWSPGAVYEYSNIGAALAAYVVEAARGEFFDDVCDRDIFGPLGMEQTGWHLADHVIEEVALPYRWDGTDYVTSGHHGYPDYPDGQLRSSVRDLSRHLRSIVNNGTTGGVTILEPTSVEEAKREQFPDVAAGQGIFWYSWEGWGGTWMGHGGSDTGVATDAWFRLEDDIGFLVLMNGEWNDEDAIYVIEEALIARGETW